MDIESLLSQLFLYLVEQHPVGLDEDHFVPGAPVEQQLDDGRQLHVEVEPVLPVCLVLYVLVDLPGVGVHALHPGQDVQQHAEAVQEAPPRVVVNIGRRDTENVFQINENVV